MSILYTLLKPIAKNLIKNKIHKEESYEEFAKISYDIQKKFRLKLPKHKGFNFKEKDINGFKVIIGENNGKTHKKAILYLVGGGCRRWQMPFGNSLIRYMQKTDSDIYLPLYPLYPDYNFLDEVKIILDTYGEMLKKYDSEDIIWLGFSAGADLIMMCGKSIVKNLYDLPMPGLMIPVSPCNIFISEDSAKRMKEIEKRDIFMDSLCFDGFQKYYNRDGNIPRWIMGCAKEDDYKGFPKIRMYFGGDEVFSAEAEEYEKAFIRSDVKDFKIIVKEGMFHGYPLFTFLKEGKDGENEIIEEINNKQNLSPKKFD